MLMMLPEGQIDASLYFILAISEPQKRPDTKT